MSQNLKNPTSSRLKVLLFALLPYAYILIVLAVALTPFGLLLWRIISAGRLNGAAARIEMLLVVVAAFFLRAIWVRVPERAELVLRREEAPALFAMVREIEGKLGRPKVHGVELTDQFTVCSALLPRLSLFGWPVRHYLKIGLPLLRALSPEQFKALVAQELARYGGNRDRLGSFINVRHHTWHHLLAALLVRGGWGAWLFSRFFNWYVSRFHTYSIGVSQQHELAADRVAAEVVTAEALADALLRMEYGTYLEDRFWDEEDTAVEPDIAELLQTAKTSEAEEWLQLQFEETTYPSRRYLTLKDRLAALAQQPRVPLPIVRSAAEVYLGDHLADVTERLKNKQAERLGWGQKKFPVVSRDLDELIRRSQQPDFTPFESLQLGNRLLEKDQEEGVLYLERAMEADGELTPSACFHISSYYQRKGDLVSANRYSRRSSERWEILQKAIAERTQVSFVDEFLSQNLSEREIKQLRSELTQHAEIKAAYLVRKDVRYLSDKPLHALGLVFDRPWFAKTTDDLDFTKRLTQTTANPPELYAFALDYRNRRVGKLIREVTHSLIYQRD